VLPELSMSVAVHTVWTAFKEAHRLIWGHGYWRYLAIPILLSVLMALLILVGGYQLAHFLMGWMETSFPSLATQPVWVRGLLFVLLLVLQAGPSYVIFRSLVMVLYGPFLDRLSESVELHVNGKTSGVRIGILPSFRRPLILAGYTIAASLVLFVASLALGLIPVVGWLLSIFVIWPLQLFLSSVSYVDPYLERHGVVPRSAFGRMWKHKYDVVCFGGVAAAISLIPIIGWFLGPTYSVVAGLLFSAEHLGERGTPADS
jgi:CysZ protein